MVRRYVMLAIVATGLLAGCSTKPKVTCSSSDAEDTTLALVRDDVEKAAYKQALPDNGLPTITHSSIRATINRLVLSLEDVRTTKEDPQSTKRFCTASLTVRVPDNVLKDAESVRGAANLSSVATLADQNDFEQQTDSFKVSFDYDVQPTDDGQTVYSESEDLSKIDAFLGELLASSLLRSSVEQRRIAEQQAQEVQQQQQQAAAGQQRTADQAQAKTDDQLAMQTIGAVWKALPPRSTGELAR